MRHTDPNDWRELVATLDLERHPEGGYYREVWRSPITIPEQALPKRYAGSRSAATSILFLLPFNESSAKHRVASDELWIHQGGDPCVLTIGDQQVLLGAPPNLQAVVPAREWQSATPVEGPLGYSLVACVVVPGFEFRDFELA